MQSLSFQVLADYHLDLESLFETFELALLDEEPDVALDLLVTYRLGLAAHMRDEEVLLLPLYELAPKSRYRDPLLLTEIRSDHRRILALIDRLEDGLRLPGWNVLDGLDEVTAIRREANLHSIREENLFYPALERITSEEASERLLGRLAERLVPAWDIVPVDSATLVGTTSELPGIVPSPN